MVHMVVVGYFCPIFNFHSFTNLSICKSKVSVRTVNLTLPTLPTTYPDDNDLNSVNNGAHEYSPPSIAII